MGNDGEGLKSQALQQGGIGLLLTTLIITMPTVAAALWQGSMGTFMAYSAFGTAGASNASPGPQGQPPGSYTPSQKPRDGATHEQMNMPDLNAGRVSGGTTATSSPAAPGSRRIAPTNDTNRLVELFFAENY